MHLYSFMKLRKKCTCTFLFCFFGQFKVLRDFFYLTGLHAPSWLRVSDNNLCPKPLSCSLSSRSAVRIKPQLWREKCKSNQIKPSRMSCIPRGMCRETHTNLIWEASPLCLGWRTCASSRSHHPLGSWRVRSWCCHIDSGQTERKVIRGETLWNRKALVHISHFQMNTHTSASISKHSPQTLTDFYFSDNDSYFSDSGSAVMRKSLTKCLFLLKWSQGHFGTDSMQFVGRWTCFYVFFFERSWKIISIGI